MNVHFIAIGGAVMHNLAIALHKKGYNVTGSDDEIFEPSRSRLDKYGLLPAETGWHAEKISSSTDTVILGMHAMGDNPELVRAREMGISIFSFPEYLYEQTRNKTRIVIGGSHGKTTITSMVMHVLKSCNIKFDYMVGSLIDGFETMVGLSDDSTIAVFEGDEYLSSALDRRPKFHLYKPDIAVISGIAWDHINVFPTYDEYVDQFRIFAEKISKNGTLIYNHKDSEVEGIAEKARQDIKLIPYSEHDYLAEHDAFYICRAKGVKIKTKLFGRHNMENINAARLACLSAGVDEEDFYRAIKGFQGSAKRLQLISENKNSAVYLDFAHAPSKLKATVSAIAERYPMHIKVCCFEMHTFSSLSKNFIHHYRDALSSADIAYVYYNPHAVKLKKLEPIDDKDIIEAFGGGVNAVFNDSVKMFDSVQEIKGGRIVYLFMSSGNFNGTDIKQLAEKLVSPGMNNINT